MIQEELEHHAYLVIDELDKLRDLFQKGVTKLSLDLRGRTSYPKKRDRVAELGIVIVAHKYLSVVKNNLEIRNVQELNNIMERYTQEGIENLYIIRMVVEWPNGEMHEWHRHIIHANETERTSGSGRMNALTIKVGRFTDVQPYQERYGCELVKPTRCLNMPIKPSKKRVCLGTMANVVEAVG